jgi:ribonuclease G
MNLLTTEKRIAVLENTKAAEFYFSHPSSEDLVGHIYLGRISKVLPGMQAAFVDIGMEKNGFIHRDQLVSFRTGTLQFEDRKKKSISEFVHEGETILVQVEKNSVGTKGPKLTNVIEFTGQSVVYIPNGDYLAVSKKMENETTRTYWRKELESILNKPEGAVVRTSAEKCQVQEIQEEIDKLRREYELLLKESKTIKAPALLSRAGHFSDKVFQLLGISNVEEAIVDTIDAYQRIKKNYPQIKVSLYQGRENIFSHFSVEQEVERLSKKIVWLPSGAYLIFEHTEALTVVDVNTGKFTGKSNLKETVLKTNAQAAKEIARQIRLRDIGGMILIDFIDMKTEEDRSSILYILKKELLNDRTRTKVYGFTQLGIVEMTRKRVRESILFKRTEPCLTCGNGHVTSKETFVYKLERELMELRGQDAEGVWVEATSDIIELLKKEQILQTIENALHMKIYISDLSRAKPDYKFRHIGLIKDIENRL